MGTILFIFAVLAFVIKASAAGTNAAGPLKIGATDAASHYDQEMIVTGIVAQVTGLTPAATQSTNAVPVPPAAAPTNFPEIM